VVPDTIKGICVDLAIYELYRRRGKTKVAEPRYDRAMKTLSDIAEGRLNLPGVAATDVRVSARDKVFGEEFQDEYD
jgi:phage gp36-like protein